jgi:CubicO group peptidase (beta-lactamase class C family)
MRLTVSRILLCLLVVSQSVYGQSPSELRIKRVEQGLLSPVVIKGGPGWSLQERMKHYKVPGISIAVIKDFKVEWARGYGVKDLGTREPVTAETLFQAGSISKPVAAMVALKKVEQGKLALDENINNRLTSWKLPDNEFTAKNKVTLANLLSHTAGLTVHGFPGYAVGEKLPTLPQVLDGAAPANTAAVRVNMEPASKFRYSGGGTTIAQLAIMDIEKKPYPQIAQETVLTPLGMSSSTYSQPLPDAIRPKAASGYKGDGREVAGKIHIYPEMAAAGLWTTPADLAKFAIEVQLSLQGKSNKVLSREMAARMVTPFIEDHIGLGFFIEKHGNAVYFGHGGADEGFRASLLVHKEKGYGAVVMVNSDNGQIMDEVMRGIAREYEWEDYLPPALEVRTMDAAALEIYAGRFQVSPDRVLTIQREGDKLYAEPTAEAKFELLAAAGEVARRDEFIRRDQNIRYRFKRNDKGEIESLELFANNSALPARLIGKDFLVPYELLMAGKTAEAVEGYKKIKRETPNINVVSEQRLNSLGYSLLGQKKLAEAIVILKLNVEFYPQSSNVYDSLGEAYLQQGNKELAIASYRKSLELDPKNGNAVTMLKKLGQ